MTPLFASEKRAAELLDMQRNLFRRLVGDGVLPGPVLIGDQERWDVDALRRAIRGEVAGLDGVAW